VTIIIEQQSIFARSFFYFKVRDKYINKYINTWMLPSDPIVELMMPPLHVVRFSFFFLFLGIFAVNPLLKLSKAAIIYPQGFIVQESFKYPQQNSIGGSIPDAPVQSVQVS